MAIFCKQSPHEIELLHRPIYIRDFLFRVMQQLLQHMRTLRGIRCMSPRTTYFFGCLDRLADIDYVPSQEDLLHLYIPSVGVAQYTFEVGSQDYLVYDVSGRMVERQRWTVHYDHFDALIFTLAISEFDQFYEDERGKHVQPLKHGLELLKEVASDARFKDTLLFVFLNETDIFKEKLIRYNLVDFFVAFEGNSEKDALSFMKQLAVDACAEHSEKLHLFFTTAVNTRKMHKVLNEVFKKISKSKE
ncbi:Guanine nucleotide-binding proteinalpha-13 subunit [Aphelenchoides fujianensis]|nr:Guanine nucleotide-binding proteinalpha-13 subunit [Aphelenchoides fujianensis]